MKKIIAIMMVLVMMMAVTVPSFAATIGSASQQAGDATVLTDISGVAGEGEYTVSYPATMALTWGAEETNFQYSVTSQLKTGKCVSVEIIDKDANGLVMVNGDGATLAYSLGGETSIKTTAPVVPTDNIDATYDFSVNVLKADWDAAAYDTYQDTLTFSSAVVDL